MAKSGGRTAAQRAPPPRLRGSAKGEALAAYHEFMEDEGGLRAWAMDIRAELGERTMAGSLIKKTGVLPPLVAEGALLLLQDVPLEEWDVTESYAAAGSAPHRFHGAAPADNDAVRRGLRSPPGLERSVALLFRAFGLLSPGTRHNFQLGMYSSGDHIASHDDMAFHDVEVRVASKKGAGAARGSGSTGQRVVVKQYCRDIAVIFYLTKEWEAAFGGVLVDEQTGTSFVPEFNSMVSFLVPRAHAVTPVLTSRARYSLFGWFLSPENLYEEWETMGRGAEGRGGGAGGGAGGKRKRAWRIPMALPSSFGEE